MHRANIVLSDLAGVSRGMYSKQLVTEGTAFRAS